MSEAAGLVRLTLTDNNGVTYSNGEAVDINDAGVVVGYLGAPDQPAQCVVWRNGALTTLGLGKPVGVTTSGRVLVVVYTTYGHYYRIYEADGRGTDIAPPAGDVRDFEISGFSDAGYVGVVRFASTDPFDFVFHAFIHLNGQYTVLDDRGQRFVSNINDFGQTIFYRYDSGGSPYSRRDPDGTLTRLDIPANVSAGNPFLFTNSGLLVVQINEGTFVGGRSARSIVQYPGQEYKTLDSFLRPDQSRSVFAVKDVAPNGRILAEISRGDGATSTLTSAVLTPVWAASDIALSGDNRSHILWRGVFGDTALTGVTSNAAGFDSGTAFPYVPGWDLVSIAANGQNGVWGMWNGVGGGRSALFGYDSLYRLFGAFENALPIGTVAVAVAGHPNQPLPRVLSRTRAYAFTLTIYAMNGAVEQTIAFPNYPFYQPKHFAVAANGDSTILLSATNAFQLVRVGAASGAVLSAQTYVLVPGFPSEFAFPDPSNWEPFRVAIGGSEGKTRVLRRRGTGEAALLTLSNTTPQTVESDFHFGPFPGWGVESMAVGSDNKPRLLWMNDDGVAAIWTVEPNGTVSIDLRFPFLLH